MKADLYELFHSLQSKKYSITLVSLPKFFHIISPLCEIFKIDFSERAVDHQQRIVAGLEHQATTINYIVFLHINPYGIFRLDMDSRLPIESEIREVA